MNSKSFAIPAAIILAGILIAGAIIYNSAPTTDNTQKNTSNTQKNDTVKSNVVAGLKEINSDDHVAGNPNAKLSIIEFSDTECPYCKTFHQTMIQIMENYGKDGTVKWVYRHFPLDNIHKKARKEAEATECAADIGGNQKFWDYLNRLYEITPSNDGLAESQLMSIAKYVGIDEVKFEDCLKSGRFAKEVENDYRDGISAGVNGTPHAIIVTENGTEIPLRGATPYEELKSMLDQLLESVDEEATI